MAKDFQPKKHRFFYAEYDSYVNGYGIWEHGGSVAEGVEVDALHFHVVDKIDSQTVLELLEELQCK